MDIAKYIGLFLLKNHFCYVHGLGNMELRKKPAIHDGSALQSPSYEVIVTPGGSIDDNLANFIATNEQISISKAANTLRDFSIQARKEMAAGKEVEIPNIGRFVESNDKIRFVTDDNFRFTPAGIPTIRNSKQLEEQNARIAHKPSYPTPHKADSVNWSMVILVIVLVVILGGGAFGIYYYMGQDYTTHTPSAPVKDTVPATQHALPDTNHIQSDSMVAAMTLPPDTLQTVTYKMIIGDYRTKDAADRRVKNLELGGTHVEAMRQDSLDYLVIATISCRPIDTLRVQDSLSRFFGYRNVTIYK